MNRLRSQNGALRAALVAGALLIASTARAQVEATQLFNPAAADAGAQIRANDRAEEDVTFKVDGNAIDVVVVANGKSSYPGIVIKPPKPFDASNHGHVEAKITNLGSKPIRVALRLDNEGSWQENRNNANIVGVQPGKSAIVKTIFGYNYGKPGYALQSNAIVTMLFCSSKSDAPQHWRIENIDGNGLPGEKPVVDPNSVAVKPEGGVILGGGAITARQLVAKNGAKADLANGGKAFTATLGGKGDVTFKPAGGMWNLNQYLQVRVRVKNVGNSPAKPTFQLTSRGGPSDFISPDSIAPGEQTEVVLPFMAQKPWQGLDLPEMRTLEGKKEFLDHQPGTGNDYKSNTTTGLVIGGEGTIEVTSVVGEVPPTNVPDWLGKRPPVEGDWVQTFNDDFDGDHIDFSKWNIYTETDWHLGKDTHYSKDNVIVKDGKLYLRLSKQHGHHNDDPKMPANEYATGYADTYGKWVQRYGYFEARMKLATAPNMFDAFWLMPDRGLAAGPQNVRANTKEGGMEFDIMETLSIWGPYRHDFGFHWDGYMKYHKSTGNFSDYSPPDKDGFITVGMLWTPGELAIYDNGKESGRWKTDRISNVQSYFILTHLTGGWEAEPMDDKQLPADFVFDYVRAWQRKDLASPADGPKPNDAGPLPPTK